MKPEAEAELNTMMSVQDRNNDFRERTKAYAAAIVRLYCSLPKRTETQVLGKQMLRSGTSAAANYREASRARSHIHSVISAFAFPRVGRPFLADRVGQECPTYSRRLLWTCGVTYSEFITKVETCAQEADETLLWLELLHEECGVSGALLDSLLKESDELIAILVTMAKNAKKQG